MTTSAPVAKSVPVANTVGEIARRLEEQVHRIEYVIRSRDIQPESWAGNARIFSEADVQYIQSELRRIDEERDGGGL
ncbi:MAG: hypothetical protein HQ567_04950 [Candidatus Nealsonbacteria bacterium]|nr:hypothetical protein [Candidatus Nealsonbacteria bacterium]